MAAEITSCPRCGSPHDGGATAGVAECAICGHRWRPAPARPSDAAVPPRPPSSAGRSAEYLPDEGAAPPVEDPALTGRKERGSSTSHRAVAVASPRTPARRTPAAAAAPARRPPSEPDLDLFDRAEHAARAKRADLPTMADLPAPLALDCPVCGHAFAAAGSGTSACPECGALIDPASGAIDPPAEAVPLMPPPVAAAAPPPPPMPTTPAPPSRHPEDDLIGRTVRGCRIDRKIGEGGMGSVYHATQLSLERSVAIKVLPSDLARNRSFISRFEREAKSLARINHPNILHVYDFGEDHDAGVYFMIMEFVDGYDLGEMLHRRTMLDQLEALDTIRQAALGLETAAEKGVIHRDIKPDNLMVTKEGVIKVSDFGLAKALADDKEITVTQVGVRVGTPAFMSPEQCDGVEVDWRSDVYNLGATAWLTLTGRLPYDGETPFAIMLKHKHDPVPSLRQVNPAIDPRVDALVGRMLGKRPADRAASWRQIIDDVESTMVAVAGSHAILRKTQGPMRALAADPDGGPRVLPSAAMAQRRDEPDSAPALPAQSESALPPPPAEPSFGAPPAAPRSSDLPDWLRPIELPAAPRQAGGPPPPEPAPAPMPGPLPRRSERLGALPRTGSSDRLPVPGERASRVGKRFNPELEVARARSRHALADSAIEAGERLAAAGRLDQAAEELSRAASLAATSERATELQSRARSLRTQARWRRRSRTLAIVVGVAAVAAAGLWLAPPRVHGHMAASALERARAVSDVRVRSAALANVVEEWGEPWPWYRRIFPAGYAVPAAELARAELAAIEMRLRPPEPPAPPPVAPEPPPREIDTSAIERLAADPAVPWSEVAAAARGPAERGSARARELLGQAEAAIAASQRDLAAIRAAQAAGRHGEALDRAAALRARQPRLGARLAELPLPALLAVGDLETGQPPPGLQVAVHGVAVADAGQPVRICRSATAETIVDLAAPGFLPARLRIPAEPTAEAISVPATLSPAPRWRLLPALAPAAWVRLHPAAGGGAIVHRPERLVGLRADGTVVLRYDAPPAANLTQAWMGERAAVGTDAGSLLRPIAGGQAEELHRGLGAVVAAAERESQLRTDRRLRLVVERRGDAGVLRSLDAGGGELWSQRGLAIARLPPDLPAWPAARDSRIAVFDDGAAIVTDEDGSGRREIELPSRRTGETMAIAGAGWAVPCESAVVLIRPAAPGAALAVAPDAELADAGPARAAGSGAELALARADGAISLLAWRGGAFLRLWSTALPAPSPVAPAIGADAVVAVDRTGLVVVLARADGSVRRRYQHGAAPACPPVIVDRIAVVADVAGGVAGYAIDR